MDLMIYIWLAVFVIAFIIEAVTVNLVSIWFSIAALITIALSFIPNMPYWAEIIVFFVLSFGMIIGIKPFVQKHLNTNTTKSNIEEIVGKKGLLIKAVEPLHYGEVKINDIVWSALAENEEDTIVNHSVVIVVAVQGNKLVVKKQQLENK